jgi:predicted nucleic acid-binding protein
VSVIFDACSLINLTNGQVLSPVLQLEEHYVVGPIVLSEVDLAEVQGAVTEGRLSALDDSQLDADQFLALIEEHRLGDGESECLSAARQLGYMVCTDDGKARKVTTNLLGASRLTGSLGLLQRATSQGLLDASTADGAYRRMLATGAFLPRIPRGFFG